MSKLSKRAREIAPEPALDRLDDLEISSNEARAVWNGHSAASNEARQRLAEAKSTKRRREHEAVELGIDIDPATAEADQREIDKDQRGADASVAKSKSASVLVKDIEAVSDGAIDFLNSTALSTIRKQKVEPVRHQTGALSWLKPDPLPALSVYIPTLNLKKNEDKKSYVERERETQRKLRTEEKSVKSASPSEQETVSAAMAPVRELADKSPFTLREHRGTFRVDFAKTIVDADSASGLKVPFAYDPRPAYVREHYDEIEQDVRKAVADYYLENKPLVLTSSQKRKKLAEIADALLESERRECEATWQLRAEGVEIQFRPDSDPRAVLGVK